VKCPNPCKYYDQDGVICNEEPENCPRNKALLCRLGYHNLRATKVDGIYIAECSRCDYKEENLTHRRAMKLCGEIKEDPITRNTSQTSLEVGCGFTESVQVPIYATVSLDLNMDKVEPKFHEDLAIHDSHPICADGQQLPIRSHCLDKVYWRAVLEHVPNPDRMIQEGKRVLRPGGEVEVVLPMITSHMRHYLQILFTEFPFSLATIPLRLYAAHKYWGVPGVPHIRDVKPSHLNHYFKEVKVEAYPRTHKWFRGPWDRITRKLTNGKRLPGIQGQYLVRCR